jgi:hypothetical protein
MNRVHRLLLEYMDRFLEVLIKAPTCGIVGEATPRIKIVAQHEKWITTEGVVLVCKLAIGFRQGGFLRIRRCSVVSFDHPILGPGQ